MNSFVREALGFGVLEGLVAQVAKPEKPEGFDEFCDSATIFQKWWDKVKEMEYEESKEHLLQLIDNDMPFFTPHVYKELYENYELDSKDLTRMAIAKGATQEEFFKAIITILVEHPSSQFAKTLSLTLGAVLTKAIVNSR